jgi:hypothetical protein
MIDSTRLIDFGSVETRTKTTDNEEEIEPQEKEDAYKRLQSIHITGVSVTGCLAWQERSLDVQKKREEECWNRS